MREGAGRALLRECIKGRNGPAEEELQGAGTALLRYTGGSEDVLPVLDR